MTALSARWYWAPWSIWGLAGLCIAIEAILLLADLNVVPLPRLRQVAYEYAGFWPGLLGTWQSNYSAQPYAMFVSYAFLHGDMLHLLMNMATLVSLGRAISFRVGQRGFWLVYGAAVLGGAIGFGLLTSSLQPMVGASGGLFGLIGAILAWNYVDRFTAKAKLRPILQAVLLLVLLNFALWWGMDGLLAWETHLGGFVAGWIAALLVDPRSHAPDE